MKRIAITILVLQFISFQVSSQLWKLQRTELSGGIGTTQLYGDIGGYPPGKNILGLRDFTFRNTGYNINAGINYRITGEISLKAALYYGLLRSTDTGGSRAERGLGEKTMFVEPSLTGHYYFIRNNIENSRLFFTGQKKFLQKLINSLDFYAFTGVGALLYSVSPNEKLAAVSTTTRGLTTVVPIGIGMNYICSRRINLSVEFGARFTFSDNVDGYSSAQSKSRDIYQMVNFIISYKTGK